VIDVLFGTIRAVAHGWRDEAVRRRRITQTDPVADTLEHCASEVEDQVQDLEAGAHFVTVEDYAELTGKTPQTVRSWIRRGRLQAVSTKHGLRIRRDAEPLKKVS